MEFKRYTLDGRRLRGARCSIAEQYSRPGADSGFSTHDSGVRLGWDDSQSLWALNRPRADHNKAHAVVLSSTEPEAMGVRQIKRAIHRILRVAEVNQFRACCSGRQSTADSSAFSTHPDTQPDPWLGLGLCDEWRTKVIRNRARTGSSIEKRLVSETKYLHVWSD
jgi:hypothetical protein